MSRIDSFRYTRLVPRKAPKEGDLRFLKGRQVWQIRQQVMIRGMRVVSGGRPCFEWVDRGADNDRAWQETMRPAVRWFEKTCKCGAAINPLVKYSESNQQKLNLFVKHCTCCNPYVFL